MGSWTQNWGPYEGPKSKWGRSSDPDTEGVALPEGSRCERSLSGHTENCACSGLEADKSGFESQSSVMTSEPQFPQLWLACKLTHAALKCYGTVSYLDCSRRSLSPTN